MSATLHKLPNIEDGPQIQPVQHIGDYYRHQYVKHPTIGDKVLFQGYRKLSDDTQAKFIKHVATKARSWFAFHKVGGIYHIRLGRYRISICKVRS